MEHVDVFAKNAVSKNQPFVHQTFLAQFAAFPITKSCNQIHAYVHKIHSNQWPKCHYRSKNE
jgi:hypothetical protein